MFKRNVLQVTTVFMAACSGFIPALAGDYRGHLDERRNHWQAKQSVVGGNGLPSHVARIGTYAGGISAVSFKRNGIYFSADGGGEYLPVRGRISSVEPRIISVNKRSANANCSYEAGVCVIRP